MDKEKYKNYGEVDFEDHEIEQAEERYDKINKQLEGESYSVHRK